MTIPECLQEKIQGALAELFGAQTVSGYKVTVNAAQDPRYGDYQSNIAMVLARSVGRQPRDIAQAIIDHIGDMREATAEIAGPGFINFRMRADYLAQRLRDMPADPRLGVCKAKQSKTIVIDFSAPNVAKPMHVGHVRSTIIGDALARLARFMGHRVITDNHIGDWGTQFGMILWGWKNILRKDDLEKNPIAALLDVYKRVNTLCRENKDLLTECKAELVQLQKGNEENTDIWKRCIELTREGLKKIYSQLDIRFDYWLGESFYNDALAPLVQTLLQQGIARESNGAVCVFSDGFHKPEDDPFLVFREGQWLPVPAIIRKADGGFLYATTDLATLEYRVNHFRADAIWYVVGAPQEKHFKQIFDIERMRGTVGDFRHVAFGSILGKDRRPFRTRDGETVNLQDVIDEAIERAARVIEEKNPTVPQEEKRHIARAVGIGAIKFFELSQNRLSDYIFDWDRMLSLTGDTAPYIQNSYVRICSIFRKIGARIDDYKPAHGELAPGINHRTELQLARLLVRFAEVVPATLDDCRPNLLAAYLYDLARAFHGFYEACPVLSSRDDAEKESRLALCALTARVLKTGMGLLGIVLPEKM